jgi:hypothetical protein
VRVAMLLSDGARAWVLRAGAALLCWLLLRHTKPSQASLQARIAHRRAIGRVDALLCWRESRRASTVYRAAIPRSPMTSPLRPRPPPVPLLCNTTAPQLPLPCRVFVLSLIPPSHDICMRLGALLRPTQSVCPHESFSAWRSLRPSYLRQRPA